MVVYWLMFSIPVFALFFPLRMTAYARDWMWRAICVLFAFIIGLRFQVGGDWFLYLAQYQEAIEASLTDAMELLNDPGYALLNLMSASLDWGIYGANLGCGAVIMIGVYYFCRRQPQPWIAFTVAIPYMLIVVAMGYSRQGAAMGLVLLGLVALTDGHIKRYFFWIVCAALFHKSAVLLLPLGILVSSHKGIWVIISMSIMSVLLFAVLLIEFYETLWINYVAAGLVSEGAPVRVAMNAIPAVIFLLYAKRFAPDDDERKLWTWIAIFSLACIPLVWLASTAVDRMALYFMPIQLFVYSRISYLFRSSISKSLVILSVVGGYGLVQWVLLNYATFVSIFWVPYDNAVFHW